MRMWLLSPHTQYWIFLWALLYRKCPRSFLEKYNIFPQNDCIFERKGFVNLPRRNPVYTCEVQGDIMLGISLGKCVFKHPYFDT